MNTNLCKFVFTLSMGEYSHSVIYGMVGGSLNNVTNNTSNDSKIFVVYKDTH